MIQNLLRFKLMHVNMMTQSFDGHFINSKKKAANT